MPHLASPCPRACHSALGFLLVLLALTLVASLLRSPLVRLVISVGAAALVILVLNGTLSLGQIGDTVSSWDVANQIRTVAGTCGLDVSVENVAGGVRTVLKDPTHGDVVVGYVDSAAEFDPSTCTSSQG